MSYGRIGERGVRRLLDRDGDPLVAVVGADPGGWAPGAPHRRGARSGWAARRGSTATAPTARVGPLYPLYREPGRHVAALAVAA